MASTAIFGLAERSGGDCARDAGTSGRAARSGSGRPEIIFTDMGVFERLDRLDDRVLGRLSRSPRRAAGGDPGQAFSGLFCRAGAFLREHPVLLAFLLCLDVLSLVSTIPALAAADTARRTTLGVGRIVGATTSAAMLLLVRQGRPRSALDAALAGIAVQVVQGIAVWVLEGDPRFLALAALPCIFLSFGIWGRRSVPPRCSGIPGG